VSANPEKALSLFDAARVAEELEGDATVAFLQDNSKKTDVMTFQSPKDIFLVCRIRFRSNHLGLNPISKRTIGIATGN
jgi:hypothetical protein